MTSINTIDYVSVFFSHKTVTKIVGQLSHSTLKRLCKQIKANVASDTSILSGGFHCHLGLVIPASGYNNMLGSNFTKPSHPGKLDNPNGNVIHNAIHICEEYNQQLHYFHKILAVENTPKSHIIGAINTKYIKDLINSSTETILYDIPQFSLFYLTNMAALNMIISNKKKIKLRIFNII